MKKEYHFLTVKGNRRFYRTFSSLEDLKKSFFKYLKSHKIDSEKLNGAYLGYYDVKSEVTMMLYTTEQIGTTTHVNQIDLF